MIHRRRTGCHTEVVVGAVINTAKVKVGTKVKWFYKDTTCDGLAICPGHDVKVGSRKVSATVKTEKALIYSMVFKSVGTFSYLCTYHANMGMTGRIVVTRR